MASTPRFYGRKQRSTRIAGRTSREEAAMENEVPIEAKRGVKTLAIRLDDRLHAQLTAVAQLEGLSITDAIRQAIEAFIARKRDEGSLTSKAQDILVEIDREAAERKSAIEALFGPAVEPPAEAETESPSPAKARGRRGDTPAT